MEEHYFINDSTALASDKVQLVSNITKPSVYNRGHEHTRRQRRQMAPESVKREDIKEVLETLTNMLVMFANQAVHSTL